MKGVGWIVILLGVLGVIYLVAGDLQALQGKREGKLVIEPMEKAKKTADLVNKAQDSLQKALDAVER